MTSPAFAVDPNVRAACTNDYWTFCSNTEPGSPECKTCFRKFAPSLSRQCKLAIISSPSYKHELKPFKKQIEKFLARN